MTVTHLDALIAAADLSDRDERLMLADAYEEAGRADDGAALRREDGARLADAPLFCDEVCQTTGYTQPDEFGRTMSYERRLTVTTDYADHCEGASSRREWAALHPAERLWWYETLADYHAARRALAEAAPEVREYVEARLRLDGDLESYAGEIRRLIEEAQEAAHA